MSDLVVAKKTLPDGRIVELMRMLFNYRICVSLPEHYGISYEDAWCYKSPIDAGAAFDMWNGDGDPLGWNKHPSTGRWREDGTPESETGREGRWATK
jgi:hypothetical protein